MIRRHVTVLRLLFMAADGITAAGLFAVVSMVRFGSANWLTSWTAASVDGRFLAVTYGLAWVTVTWLLGLYRLRARLSLRSELVGLFQAVCLVAVATFTALFLFKLPNVSRLFLIELFAAQIILSAAVRIGLRQAFAWARSTGRNTRWVLVVGADRTAEAFADLLERNSDLGLRVVGHLTGTGGRTQGDTRKRPILGPLDSIATVLHEHVVDQVAICLPAEDIRVVEPIARLCEEEGRIVRIPLDDLSFTLPGGRVEELDGLPILSLVYGPDRMLGLFAKRLADVAIAIVGLVVLSPLLLAVSIVIIAIEGPPVIFSQVRVGLNGRYFRIHKFRTMTRDAEARYSEVVSLSDTKGAAFKMRDDPRVTRLGRMLRRTSIDELPQLLNVIRGDMSIVGPRPAPPREVAGYDIWHRRRLSMKPGITGLWQVESRFDEEFDQRVTLDLDYIDRWSLWLDIKIMLRTIPALFAGEGR
jgi:exopolysaccharide biosynthesis polyprenyl glycosylphosphotransferase